MNVRNRFDESAVARSGLRRRPTGLPELLAARACDGVHRLRSDRVEPPCRIAAAGHGAGAAAALRPYADCHRRRRHRDDRRSERQVAGAAAAVAGADRGERRRHSGAAGALSRFRRRERMPRASSTTPTGSAPIDLLSFLRDAGKHFTVNYMLQKESVSRRLESEEGISFTEFSYLLLQAYDFLQLFDRYGCTLQMGGSDQWGNITAGIDLIRKLRGEEGARPGVAAGDDGVGREVRQDRSRAVWLDRGADVTVSLLPVLAEHRRPRRHHVSEVLHVSRTARSRARGRARASEPEKREAQRVLAREVTTLVHGDEQVARAEHASALLFGEDIVDAAGRGRAGGLRGRAVHARSRRSSWARRGCASSSCGRVEARAVEERSAPACAVRRCLRQQSPDYRRRQRLTAIRRSGAAVRCCGRVRSRITRPSDMRLERYVILLSVRANPQEGRPGSPAAFSKTRAFSRG